MRFFHYFFSNLILINRIETSVRGPAQSYKDEYDAHNKNLVKSDDCPTRVQATSQAKDDINR